MTENHIGLNIHNIKKLVEKIQATSTIFFHDHKHVVSYYSRYVDKTHTTNWYVQSDSLLFCIDVLLYHFYIHLICIGWCHESISYNSTFIVFNEVV